MTVDRCLAAAALHFCRRSRPGASGRKVSDFKLAQRPETGGHSRPPRAGRHPHDLVQGRRRRRDAGQVGPRAFPRAPDVQGHGEQSGRRFSQVVARIGGQENAFTSNDYTGYFQRVPSDQLKTVMEFEADRMTGLRAHRRGGAARARRHPGRAQPAHREQSARPPGRADRRGALSQPSLWQAGDRLAPRDGAAQPRRRARLLQALLRPQQRGRRDRRRRRRRRRSRKLAEETYGRIAAHATIPPRLRPQEPPPAAARSLTLADPRVEMPSVQRDYLVPSFAPRKPGNRKRSKCSRTCSAAARTAGSTARWSSTSRSPSSAGAWYEGTALDMTKFGFYASPRPGVTLPQLEAGADAVIAEVIDKGVDAGRTRAQQDPADRRRRLCAGQPGQHGALVRQRADDRRHRRRRAALARAHPRGHRRAGAGRRARMARQAALGHRLSDQGYEPAAEKRS